MTGWIPLARALTARMAEQGLLDDPRWRAAFEQVPRHVFVPRFYTDDGGDQRFWLDDPDHPIDLRPG